MAILLKFGSAKGSQKWEKNAAKSSVKNGQAEIHYEAQKWSKKGTQNGTWSAYVCNRGNFVIFEGCP